MIITIPVWITEWPLLQIQVSGEYQRRIGPDVELAEGDHHQTECR